METRNLTPREKQLLKQIALVGDPNGRMGFTVVYNPECPEAIAGCYVPCVPPSGEVWKNDICCPKIELDEIQQFADLLERTGALRVLDRKEKDNGGYHAYYLATDRFEEVYGSLDPDGLAEVAAIIEDHTPQQANTGVR